MLQHGETERSLGVTLFLCSCLAPPLAALSYYCAESHLCFDPASETSVLDVRASLRLTAKNLSSTPWIRATDLPRSCRNGRKGDKLHVQRQCDRTTRPPH